MSKSMKLAPLADTIVEHTPFISYENKTELFMNITDRNANKYNLSSRSIEMLVNMVEKRLRDRDGYAYLEEELCAQRDFLRPYCSQKYSAKLRAKIRSYGGETLSHLSAEDRRKLVEDMKKLKRI